LKNHSMSFKLPEPALVHGFVNDPVGTHGSRTFMLKELRLLLASCPPGAYAQPTAAVDPLVDPELPAPLSGISGMGEQMALPR
jgi:hypothetical protein